MDMTCLDKLCMDCLCFCTWTHLSPPLLTLLQSTDQRMLTRASAIRAKCKVQGTVQMQVQVQVQGAVHQQLRQRTFTPHHPFDTLPNPPPTAFANVTHLAMSNIALSTALSETIDRGLLFAPTGAPVLVKNTDHLLFEIFICHQI